MSRLNALRVHYIRYKLLAMLVSSRFCANGRRPDLRRHRERRVRFTFYGARQDVDVLYIATFAIVR